MTQSLRHLVVATATALLTCTCAVAPNSSLEPTANAIPTAASVASGPVPTVEDADLARAKAAAAAFRPGSSSAKTLTHLASSSTINQSDGMQYGDGKST